MKKFRLALMAVAVLSFTAFYSCGGGMTEEEAQKQAEEMVSGLESALDEAMEEPAAEEPVAEEAPAEEVTEEPAAEGEAEATEEHEHAEGEEHTHE